MKLRTSWIAFLVVSLIIGGSALAHLGAESRAKATHIHDLVQATEAEDVVEQKDRIQADPSASAGSSVIATPGTRFELRTPELNRGVYAFYVSGRMDERFLSIQEDGPAVLFRFTIDSGRDGTNVVSDDIHGIYSETWQYVQEMYFHADAGRRAYQATIEIQTDSPGELIIDRIELRDALSGVVIGAYKNSRNLLDENEIARLAEQGRADQTIRYRYNIPKNEFTPEERAERDRELAARIPNMNSLSTEAFSTRAQSEGQNFSKLAQDFQQFLGGVHQPSGADEYLLNLNENLARDAAFMLALTAYNWPSYNYRLTHIHCGQHDKTQRIGQFKRRWGKMHIYRGWAGPMIRGMLRSYDHLFPYIQGNEELARAVSKYVPWVETPEDVIALLDSYLVQLSWRDYQRGQGASPIELVAAVLGPCELSESLLGEYSRFRKDLVSHRSRDGLSYIGSTYYAAASAGDPFETADLLERYVAAGGDVKWNIANPEKFPRLNTVFDTILGISVAGGMRNNTGDLGNPHDRGNRVTYATVKDPDRFFYSGWKRSGDPRFAWLMANEVKIPNDVTPEDREAIIADANNTGDPLLHQTSRVQSGFGIAVMEAGQDVPDSMFKRTAVIRTGVASGHAQSDSLNLALYAYGIRMAPDIGGRGMGSYGRPSTHHSRLHNLVEVDKRPMGGTAINATGKAWVDYFAPIDGAQVTQASSRAESHPDVSLYTRSTALIDISPGSPDEGILPNSYVFDVFRVKGGSTHTYCFHGAVSDEFETNADLVPATNESAIQYLAGHRPDTFLEGTSRNPLEAVWRLRRTEGSFMRGDERILLPNTEKEFLGERYNPDAPPKYTRLTLFNHGDEKVMSGHAYCYQARKYSWPMLYVQNESADSIYPAIIEASEGESVIESKRLLDVSPAGEGSDSAVAMEIITRELPHEPSHRDIILQAPYSAGTVLREVEGALKSDGSFVYVSTDDIGLRMAQMIGGVNLETQDGLVIQSGRSLYNATIVSVDYFRRELTIDGEWPVNLLVGEHMRLGNDTHLTDYTIESGRIENGKTVLRWSKSAATWLGVVADIFADEGYVVPETEPELFNYHPDYYDGMTAVAESGATWKVEVDRGDRWMFLGFPVAAAHQNSISWDDIPDADGDGRRTLIMYRSGRSRDRRLLPDGALQEVEEGERMLELEITRIREDGRQFWFKQHDLEYVDSLGVPHRGWPYHEQILKNETGEKEWLSVLPEDDTRIYLKDAPVSAEALADVDGDGKRGLTFYDFGVGDIVEIPSRIVIRRQPDGRISVDANVSFAVNDITVDLDRLKDGPITIDLNGQQ